MKTTKPNTLSQIVDYKQMKADCDNANRTLRTSKLENSLAILQLQSQRTQTGEYVVMTVIVDGREARISARERQMWTGM